MIWLLVVIAAIAIICLTLRRRYQYWIQKGVVQGNPVWIFGDTWKPLLKKQSNAEMIQELYNIAPNARYSGIYQVTTPTLLIKDPDLIKQITVKDFDHFVDHRTIISEDADPLFARNIFFLTGQRWRDMRSNLSPAFTSSKMKYMFSLILQNSDQFVRHFLKEEKSLIIVEMKEISTKFTNDVIANVVFGIECDSLKNPSNEFYQMGLKITSNSMISLIKIFSYMLLPSICKMLKVNVFGKKLSYFFSNIVKENVECRQRFGVKRPDMINLLLEARKHGLQCEETNDLPDTGFATVTEPEIAKNKIYTKTQITDDDIVSQAVIFFFAGFDSVASLMCFMSYELAVNPVIQEKLRQEVDLTADLCSQTLTYEALMKMTYMDMVVSETLRKWPNAPAVDRVCTKPYTIEPQLPHEKPIHLKKDDIILLPYIGLHRDPNYFPNPDRFEPERFDEENKHKIKPYTYLPFGSGPRNCIGSRFALMEVKALFFHLLSHFEIVPVHRTPIPLKLAKTGMTMNAEGGFWIGLKQRIDKND